MKKYLFTLAAAATLVACQDIGGALFFAGDGTYEFTNENLEAGYLVDETKIHRFETYSESDTLQAVYVGDFAQIENDTITSDDLAKALAETATEVKTETPDQAPQVVAKQKELASKSETVTEAVQVAEQIMEEDKEVLEKLEDTPIEKPTVKLADEEQQDPAPAVEEAKEEKPRGGLASAVAKVQTPKPVVKEKTAKQEEKEKGGVKRL